MSAKRRFQSINLIFLMFLNGIAELLSLSLIIPFISLLVNKEKLFDYPFINNLVNFYGIKNSNELITFITFLFVLIALLAMLIRVFNLYISCKFSGLIGSDLSTKAYRNLISRPYMDQIKSNSSDLIIPVTNHITAMIGVINNFLQLLLSFLIIFSILLSFITTNINLTFLTLIFLGFSYLIIIIITNKRTKRISRYFSIEYSKQLKSLQESFSSIKDIYLTGSFRNYLENFKEIEFPLRGAQQEAKFLTVFPRYLIEFVAISSIVVLFSYLTINEKDFIKVIPSLAFVALGLQKLLPACQNVYANWTQIKTYSDSVKKVIKILDDNFLPEILKKYEPFELKEKIKIRNLGFNYSGRSDFFLKNISIEIKKGEKIGIIGSTGSGKSTFIDLLMGLLIPSNGKIFIDNLDLFSKKNTNTLYRWRAAVAHVPQNVFLSDNSFLENIAIGFKKNEIDLDRVKKVSEVARIKDFIESTSMGFNTNVGERGVSLSGGQIQRLGIARALYKESTILVLDEATSALDIYTEKQVMKSLNNLNKKLTVFIVAHRISTVQNCDKLLLFSNGNIKSYGTPEEIIPLIKGYGS